MEKDKWISMAQRVRGVGACNRTKIDSQKVIIKSIEMLSPGDH